MQKIKSSLPPCVQVIPATQHQLHVSLHYAEKKDVATSGQCIGTEEYETVEEAARACTKDEECSGFKAPPQPTNYVISFKA